MKHIKRVLPALQRRLAQGQNNRRIQQFAKKVERASVVNQDAPVLFFNATTRLSGLSLNAGFSLLTSWAVRLAGVPVLHFTCDSGMSRCVLGTRQDDPSHAPPCAACKSQSRVCYTGTQIRRFRYHRDPELDKVTKGLSLAELETFEFSDLPLGKLVLPSLRWILRRHHLLDDEQTRYLYRQYISSAWNVAQKFLAMLESVTPRSMVVFNGMFYPEATVRYIGLKRGIRVITHEVGMTPFSGFFTNGEATAYPIDISDDFQLSEDQNQRLDAYLSNRFQGHFTMAGIQFWPEIRNLSQELLDKIAQFKHVVPIFTNVVFDTSQGHANKLFTDMFAWLDDVLEVVKKNSETLFIIRAHPDELRAGKESRESVAGWVVERKIKEVPNAIFYNATDYVSSYELIQMSKFVMVYNSTIGLEASILGKTVLSGGKARYTQIETVYFPENKKTYHQLLKAFLEADIVEPPSIHRINARRFLYYQLFCTSIPFGEYFEEDRVFRGYVRLKKFPITAIRPENSSTIQVILDGILQDKPFTLEP